MLIATHDVAQARAGTACCASTGARSRSARPRATLTADVLARDLRRRDRRRAGPGARRPRPRIRHAVAARAVLDALSSRGGGDHAPALLEVVLVGVAGGALGCWVVLLRPLLRRRVARARDVPRARRGGAAGIPLVLGGAAGLVRRRGGVALAARVRGARARHAVAVVVTTLFGLGVLLALSPARRPGSRACCSATCSASRPATSRSPAALRRRLLAGLLARCTGGCSPSASTAARARALGVAPAAPTPRCSCCWRARGARRRPGAREPARGRGAGRPRGAARAFTRRVAPMSRSPCGLGVAGGVAGLYLSYYAGVAAGAAIAGVLVATAAVATGYRRGMAREA